MVVFTLEFFFNRILQAESEKYLDDFFSLPYTYFFQFQKLHEPKTRTQVYVIFECQTFSYTRFVGQNANANVVSILLDLVLILLLTLWAFKWF